MHPILFEILGFQIHAFGFLVAMGFMAGLAVLHLLGPRAGLDSNGITALFILILAAGIAGARILYVAVHLEIYLQHPFEVFMIWRGGYVLYGGFLGGSAAAVMFAKRKGLSLPGLADAAAPCFFLGLAIGRIGCFLVGDCYGKPAPDWLPWAVCFPWKEGSSIPDRLVYVPLHPTQIYLSLNALLLFMVTLWIVKIRRFEGQAALAGTALYAFSRGALECFRGDDAERGGFGPLSTSQWVSLAALLAVCVIYLRIRRRRGKTSSA